MARASLEELLEDYLDYLRVRDVAAWGKTAAKLFSCESSDGTKIRPMRPIGPISRHAHLRSWRISSFVLFTRQNYLLDQQKRQLERAFLQQGGLRERMTKARLAERARPQQ